MIRRLYAFEINLTYRCNLACRWCDRLMGVAPIRDGDVTMNQIEHFAEAIMKADWHINNLKLAGGEPTLHPQWAEIAKYLVAKLRPRILRVVVLTNGRIDVKSPGRHIRIERDPPSEKHHVPFHLSPADLSIVSTASLRRACPITNKCGPAWDTWGFTLCPPAGAIGHAIGINPYHQEPTVSKIPAICRHCILSIRQPAREVLRSGVLAGAIGYPTETFARGIEELQQGPRNFPKWQSP